MKVLVLLSALVSASVAQSCDSSFGSYLNALKTQVDNKGDDLENEFRDDYQNLCKRCFSTSDSDDSKCALPDFSKDVYGPDGPLQSCPRCQKLAGDLHDKFMKSSPTIRQCFRQQFAEAVRSELEPCIQGKISNGYSFKVPAIPDFDEKSFNHIATIEQGINNRIAAGSRLDACSARYPERAQTTQTCLKNEYPGIYSKHCDVSKAARATVSSGCSSRFDEVRKATCQCMDEKREDWHQRFAKIQEIVSNAQSAKKCGDDISGVVGEWLKKLQDAITTCLPDQAKGQDLHTLIELGCGQVINGGVKQNELTTGFRFIRQFLDALNDRLTIYCDKNCSA